VGHFLNIIAKYLNGLRKSPDSEDKKSSTVVIQVVLLGVFPIFYSLTLMPPGVSVIQVISAGIAFILIVLFALRVMKYFNLM
jgi:hypothetical protein|tara:strand:+ start:931 stop:1176 length:246 start_codon:yes stop_codon:yes gene_type:complete